MDSLTHLLMGHTMGALAGSVSPSVGTAVYWAALVGNSLPDIDVPFSLLTGRGIKLHRTYTHTIPGVVILSAAAAALLHSFFPQAGVTMLFAWTLLGSLVHVAMDGLNLFGVKPFWPFNGQAVELGVLHIMDPYLLVMLGAPTVGTLLNWSPAWLEVIGFLGIWPYVIFRLNSARRLLLRLRANGLRARVVPWYASWRYILETEGLVEFGCWQRGRRVALETFVKQEDPRIDATMQDPRVCHFLRSAEYPVALVEEDAVVWIDAVRRLRADFRPLRIPVQS